MKYTQSNLATAITVYALFVFLITGCTGCSTPVNEGAENVIDSDGCLVDKISSSDDLKGINVNLFLETSGSMSGFMDKRGTAFQNDVWSLVESLDTKLKSAFGLYEVRSKSEPVNTLDIRSFRNNLNTGGFVSSKSTDIPEMLDSILAKAEGKTVSILVSDLIFSPEDGNMARMRQITTDIKKRFSDKRAATILLQLNSEFYKKSSRINDSPYYVWIMGEQKAADAVAKLLKSALANIPNQMDVGINKARPRYSILPAESALIVADASPLACAQDGNYYTYSEYDPGDSGKMKFWIGVDLSDLPGYMQSNAYLKSNITIDAKDAKGNIQQVSDVSRLKNSEDVKLVKNSHLTHMIQIELSDITSNIVVSINIKQLRPMWVSDMNLDIDNNLRMQTYGLEKMITGLESAYGGTTDHNTFTKPIELIITQNKN